MQSPANANLKKDGHCGQEAKVSWNSSLYSKVVEITRKFVLQKLCKLLMSSRRHKYNWNALGFYGPFMQKKAVVVYGLSECAIFITNN